MKIKNYTALRWSYSFLGKGHPAHERSFRPLDANLRSVLLNELPWPISDSVFIERLWGSLKHEAMYLQELPGGFETGHLIANWIESYSDFRSHSEPGGRKPSEGYRDIKVAT